MNWPLHQLGEITDKIGSGSTPRGGDSAYKETGVPLVRSMNVHDGAFKPDGLAFIDQEQARLLQNVTLQKGDVLINITGASVARSCILPERYAGGRVNQHVAIIRPMQRLDAGFLNYFLTADVTKRKLLNTAGGGATREALTKSQLEALEIPLPPLDEQKRIAAILDKADQLRQKRRQAIALLDSLTQSIFLEMFGDPVSNPKQLPIKSLGSLVSKVGSGATPKGGDASYKLSGIPLIRSMNVRDGAFKADGLAFIDDDQAKKLNNVIVESGDVLMNITGASVARVCRAPTLEVSARVNQHVVIIRPKGQLDSYYLEALLLTPSFKRKLLAIGEGGATRQAITKTQIEDLPVPVPSVDDQKQFRKQVERIEFEMDLSIEHISLLEQSFSSLQHRAFSGQL